MKPTIGTTKVFDRQSGKRSDETYLKGLLARPDARFLVLADQKPVIVSNADRTEASLRWLSRADIEAAGLVFAPEEALFLGVDRKTGAGHFAVGVNEHRTRHAPGVLEYLRPVVDLRTLAMQGVMNPEELSLAGQAKALIHWHENARCCGHCGGTTLIKDGGWKRKCWACGLEHFPRTDPVVIMLVVDPTKKRCLLGHEARFAKEPRMYSTLAGFIEPGEDVDDAVRREVSEEAGLMIGDVRFHSTQPWPFPHSLMIGCIGIAESFDIQIDPIEIEEARWFGVDEVRQMLDGKHPEKWWVPGKQAIARALIQSFVDGTY
jgi:NAD+ diphosphatase